VHEHDLLIVSICHVDEQMSNGHEPLVSSLDAILDVSLLFTVQADMRRTAVANKLLKILPIWHNP
jgi:hypothetical protein